MKRTFLKTLLGVVSICASAWVFPVAAQTLTLHAATQFNDDHDYNRTLKRFGELATKYYGKPIEVVIHGNSELGVERDYAKFMNQGISVDVSILAGSNMSNFTKAASLLDVPFVFRDRAHWNLALSKKGLNPLFDLIEQQSGMEVLGMCGGSTRHLVANKPIRNMKELAGYKMRVIGAPIQGKLFSAMGAKPSVIAYNEIYNAIQSGVIEGLENEAPAVLNAKFYEVAPDISLTSHAVVSRLLVISGKTMKKFPADLQAALRKAGEEAAAFNRELQAKEDSGALEKMVSEKKARAHQFTERDKLLELSRPVVAEFAKDASVEKILADIQNIR
jgi:tripartite ATP-independent transporter DctP family solute receptor